MDEPVAVQSRQPRRNLPGNPDEFLGGCRPPLNPGFEGLAVEQFHDQEHMPAFLECLEHSDEVRVLDPGQGASLAEEACPAGGQVGPQLRVHHLERDPPPKRDILGLENKPHPADPEQPQDAVGADAAEFARSFRWREERVRRGWQRRVRAAPPGRGPVVGQHALRPIGSGGGSRHARLSLSERRWAFPVCDRFG